MKVFGVTGWKNTGKTGLMERLVSEFTNRGLTVSTIKHAHHAFDVDHKGKDSFRHRVAGAKEVVVSSGQRFALMHELREQSEPALSELLHRMTSVDLILIEGYKREAHPKIEAYRSEIRQTPRAADDPTIQAVASDTPLALDKPVFDLNDTLRIADFIAGELDL